MPRSVCMYRSSKWLLELFRTFRYCEVHIGCFIHVHEISFIRKIRRWNMRSLCSSVRHWARSLVRTVLLIHRVRYTAEFQAVKVYHFPLPGIVDCLDTIGYITNPCDHNVARYGSFIQPFHHFLRGMERFWSCPCWTAHRFPGKVGLQSFVPGRSGSFLALHTWKWLLSPASLYGLCFLVWNSKCLFPIREIISDNQDVLVTRFGCWHWSHDVECNSFAQITRAAANLWCSSCSLGRLYPCTFLTLPTPIFNTMLQAVPAESFSHSLNGFSHTRCPADGASWRAERISGTSKRGSSSCNLVPRSSSGCHWQ